MKAVAAAQFTFSVAFFVRSQTCFRSAGQIFARCWATGRQQHQRRRSKTLTTSKLIGRVISRLDCPANWVQYCCCSRPSAWCSWEREHSHAPYNNGERVAAGTLPQARIAYMEDKWDCAWIWCGAFGKRVRRNLKATSASRPIHWKLILVEWGLVAVWFFNSPGGCLDENKIVTLWPQILIENVLCVIMITYC